MLAISVYKAIIFPGIKPKETASFTGLNQSGLTNLELLQPVGWSPPLYD